VKERVVFDTSSVVSALLSANGRLAWLRQHWREGGCVPLICHVTAAELTRVFAYTKFGLSAEDRRELLADYLPYCQAIEVTEPCKTVCRDTKDQAFLDLAQSGKAATLVSSNRDLLVLDGQTEFRIESPEVYRQRILELPCQ
jgi:putative PIN family toxin of toxin-antitoxin system